LIEKRAIVGLALLLTALAAVLVSGVSGSAEESPAPATLEEVLVTGERPGPGMWRVSKDGHDLWTLFMGASALLAAGMARYFSDPINLHLRHLALRLTRPLRRSSPDA
jgi:hypothetical protein